MNRRQFTNVLMAGGLLGWMGSALYPILSFLKPPKIPEANVSTVK
ncbi:MAG: cytochrome b6-f complex iron-sulfur subunit, partial [Candidatus Krumholzibacteria bacterium]|nr:cytochrome b6-f complex iron-sulfur subunit [Candidatus Krumholzibacteria bacterium]